VTADQNVNVSDRMDWRRQGRVALKVGDGGGREIGCGVWRESGRENGTLDEVGQGGILLDRAQVDEGGEEECGCGLGRARRGVRVGMGRCGY